MKTPMVTIGIPVYNGEAYLEEALTCARTQTYGDLEIVISDNGSTDRTREICERHGALDSRIRYYRFETNQGLLKNFNRVYELALGTYFKFSPHDDLYDPSFIERCVDVLERDQDTVACSSRFLIIDEEGTVTGESHEDIDADASSPRKRFYALLNNTKCYDLFAVIRKSALDRMPKPLLPVYGHADGVLLARLGMLGRIHRIPEPLYYNRDHKSRGHYQFRTYRGYIYFLDPSKQGSIVFPRWRMAAEFFRTVGMFPLPLKERMACYGLVVRWCSWYWKSFAWNIIDVLGMIVKGEVVRAPRPLTLIEKP